MPSIEIWGPACWTFFHTIACKIKNESFPIIGKQLFEIIYSICSNLPCPNCSNHAKLFFSKNSKNIVINKKEDLINFLYLFHNSVNTRKKKPLFNSENLEKYSSNNLLNCYNNFITTFHTNNNMKLLNESFQRKIVVNNVKNWILVNNKHFYS